jgi:hypothetical protein
MLESQEKEKKLTSFKNIVFAHLDVKLKTARIKIAKEIARFDKDAKGMTANLLFCSFCYLMRNFILMFMFLGYLTYDEFKDLVATFKFKFTEIQLSEVLVYICDYCNYYYSNFYGCRCCVQLMKMVTVISMLKRFSMA